MAKAGVFFVFCMMCKNHGYPWFAPSAVASRGGRFGVDIPPFASLRNGLEIRTFSLFFALFKPTSECNEEWDLYARVT